MVYLFKYIGSVEETLSGWGEEVDLIPGKNVEISPQLQQHPYFVELLNLGYLHPISEEEKEEEERDRRKPEDLYPLAGYPFYANFGPKDWMLVEGDYYTFIGEKAHKTVWRLLYKEDLAKAKKAWEEENGNTDYPDKAFNEHLGKFYETKKTGGKQPDRWLIAGKIVDPPELPIELQGTEKTRRLGYDYPFFRKSAIPPISRTVTYPSEKYPDYFTIEENDRKIDGQYVELTVNVSDWIRDYKAATEFEENNALWHGGVRKEIPEPDFIVSLKSLYIDRV